MARVLLSLLLLLPGIKQLDVDGAFTEPLSGLVFPQKLLGWDRTEVAKYPDPGGHSVTFEFNDHGVAQARATVYVYPHVAGMPASLREHLDAIVSVLHDLRPDMEVVQEKDVTLDKDGRTFQNRLATILYRTGSPPFSQQPAIGFVQVARVDTYWFKWRITCPVSACDEIPARVTELMSAFLPRR